MRHVITPKVYTVPDAPATVGCRPPAPSAHDSQGNTRDAPTSCCLVTRLSSGFRPAFPARNPRGKVPQPVEHCQYGAQREQGEQYIDRRRRAVQWTERFAPRPGRFLFSWQARRYGDRAFAATVDRRALSKRRAKGMTGFGSPPRFPNNSAPRRQSGMERLPKKRLTHTKPPGIA